jgi:hypothetical protein
MKSPTQIRQYFYSRNLKKSQFSEVINQLKSIPWASIFNLALASGGLMLLVFFSSIEYMPDFDIKTLLSVLLGVSVVGLALILIMGLFFLMPYFFIVENAKDKLKDQLLKDQLFFAFVGIICSFIAVVMLSFGIWEDISSGEIAFLVIAFLLLNCLLITNHQAKKTQQTWIVAIEAFLRFSC